MKATFLITGGSGFIGACVIRELLGRGLGAVVYDLADGGELWARLLREDRREIQFVRGDIRDAAALGSAIDAHGVSHIIHLAGLLTPGCQQDPIRGCEINVLGTVRLLELLRERRDRIRGLVYASSYAAHGPAPESGRGNPETIYGACKRTVEWIAEQYWRHSDIPSVGLRPFVVYGAGRETGISAAPSLAARAVAENTAYAISFSGTAGLVFVEDVARAFVRCALEIPRGSHVVDMPGQEVSMQQVIEMLDWIQPGAAGLLSISGPPLGAVKAAKPFLIEQLFADWRATSLEEGFRRTVDGWRAMGGGVRTAPQAGDSQPLR